MASLVLAGLAVLVGVGAWLWPKSGSPGTAAQQNPVSAPSLVQETGTSGGEYVVGPSSPASPTPQEQRFLAEIDPLTGASEIERQDDSSHTLTIPCAPNLRADTQRQVSWYLPGPYEKLSGRIEVTGDIDRESRVQVEILVSGKSEYNNSQLALGEPREFEAPLNRGRDLKIKVTCQDRDGVVSLLGVAMIR